METVQLVSSSEDDDDMYLNSVTQLKALKKKRTLPQSNCTKAMEKAQENNEDLKHSFIIYNISYLMFIPFFLLKHHRYILTFIFVIEIPDDVAVPVRPSRNTGRKKNTSRRRATRRRQKRDTSESDSDLEIVSVEEKQNPVENDLILVEKKVDENCHISEEETYEINIKVLWRSKDVHRLNISKSENFQKVFEYFANLEQVSIDEILITKKDRTITKNDTPTSINLSVIDILEGGIIKQASLEKDTNKENDENICVIKVQTTSKKNLLISVKRDENFKTLLERCAQELNIEQSKIKLYFDGELVTITDTPDSLEIEDEACFDLRLSS
ncbi:DNA repair protein Rad60 [Xylocopa sonorina]|uniref:DNA repair protein Rad60 n=1 Tax=Xylocopa sonorina TaxID=1818115 RepID=UPI00403AA694